MGAQSNVYTIRFVSCSTNHEGGTATAVLCKRISSLQSHYIFESPKKGSSNLFLLFKRFLSFEVEQVTIFWDACEEQNNAKSNSSEYTDQAGHRRICGFCGFQILRSNWSNDYAIKSKKPGKKKIKAQQTGAFWFYFS